MKLFNGYYSEVRNDGFFTATVPRLVLLLVLATLVAVPVMVLIDSF